MFDGAGDDAVCDAGEGAGEVVLGVGEGVGGRVEGFKVATGVVEGAELHGDLGGRG